MCGEIVSQNKNYIKTQKDEKDIYKTAALGDGYGYFFSIHHGLLTLQMVASPEKMIMEKLSMMKVKAATAKTMTLGKAATGKTEG